LRDQFLRGAVLFGATAVLLTESLSLFHLLRRGPVAAAWIVVLVTAAIRFRPKLRRPAIGVWEGAIAAAIVAIAIPIALSAWHSPPNSADAMAYHLPRVIYWAQSGSVAFFPTPYYNQVMLSPTAEYLMLHSYLLSGGDSWINLLTFGAYLASIVAVSALAGALGLGRRGQAIAALFCATLPNGILQASGAKNDWLLTFWLLLMAYFAVRRNAPLAGLALGLALATKGTGYLFAPPLLAVTMPWARGRAAAFLLGGVLLINTPQYVRNIRLSGSPLGYDSAQGDGAFRWRNEHLGWKPAISNALRNTSEQLGARSARWNTAVFEAVLRMHRALGLDPQDPGTTWRWSQYGPPRNSNHEADANNRWHMLLIAIAAIAAIVLRRRQWLLYAIALAAAWLLFCFYLKWQPFQSRLELPLFVLASPLAAFWLESIRPRAVAALVCLFLVSAARLPALENWTRPLKGPRSVLHTARNDNYFSDMTQWNNRESYLAAVDRTAATGCDDVAIDISVNQLEYPFQALLRQRNPRVRFTHPAGGPTSCAVLCLDCLGDAQKIAAYRNVGPPIEIGRFLLFLSQFRK
jgi:hypothetical protein